MTDYARLSTRQLGRLLEQSKRSEQDFQRRIEARRTLEEPADAHLASSPDSVTKRLGFLLAHVRTERRVLERELASRRRTGHRASRGVDEIDREPDCTEQPVAISGVSAATPHAVPTAVA